MKNYIYAAALVASALTFSSCELDEYNPSAGDATLENHDAWEGLANYCYSPLATQLYSVYDFLSVAEGGTDMWLCPSGQKDYAKQPIYYDGLTTSTNATNKLFKQAYSSITQCGTVISRAGTDPKSLVIAAEARTLRAFYYYLLATYYGPVTLVDGEVGDVNVKPVRVKSIDNLFTQMETDLTEALKHLGTTSSDGNYARVTKKTAQGILCRVYAQWAGEAKRAGDTAKEKELWDKAQKAAEYMIGHKDEFGWDMYENIDDLWAQANNRNNKEALFVASGTNTADIEGKTTYTKNNLFTYTICKPSTLSDWWPAAYISDKQDYYLGRTNNNTFAPSKYSIDVFDASWDRRYENTFMTAFGTMSMKDCGWMSTTNASTKISRTQRTKYGMGTSSQTGHAWIIPYLNVEPVTGGGYNQYVPTGVWKKGEPTITQDATGGDVVNLSDADLMTDAAALKNVYVIDYPVAQDDNRFYIVMSKEAKTADEKKLSPYFTVNIDDMYGTDEFSTEYKDAAFDGTDSYKLYPSLIKFDWTYNGAWGNGLNQKTGDVMIMRMAEIYLIAAEAAQQLGDGKTAAKWLNHLRNRAARPGTTAPQIDTATEDDVLDEYAREMAGEFNRWALLKRHMAFEARLPKYNKRAAKFFDKNKHYYRPISQDFLNQIENKDEYGDNGYGVTPSKGF